MVSRSGHAIEASLPDAKPMQLEYDRIWIELWPIDKQSEAFARDVKQGRKLSDQDRVALQSDRELLSRLQRRIANLTPDLGAHFGETVSESMLDMAYALHAGSTPASMRLGRGE